MECKYFGICGSCTLGGESYEKQLQYKVDKEKDRFSPLYDGKIDIIKSDDGYIDTKKIENLHRNSIIKSYVLLQGNTPNITRFNQQTSCFFTDHTENYKALKTKYDRIHISNSAHIKEPAQENETISNYLKRIQQPIKDFLAANNCQQIYFEANKLHIFIGNMSLTLTTGTILPNLKSIKSKTKKNYTTIKLIDSLTHLVENNEKEALR